MEEVIEVNEKYSNNWKPILYFSLIFATITFVIYLNLNDVLWTGIFRLIAFMSFTLSIFCMLKVMEGRKTFRLSIENGSLHIAYLKNQHVIQEEILDKNKIESVYRVPSTSKFKVPFSDYRFSFSKTCNFKVRFNDTNKDICLFKFGGRVLTVDEESGRELQNFFSANNLYSQS